MDEGKRYSSLYAEKARKIKRNAQTRRSSQETGQLGALQVMGASGRTVEGHKKAIHVLSALHKSKSITEPDPTSIQMPTLVKKNYRELKRNIVCEICQELTLFNGASISCTYCAATAHINCLKQSWSDPMGFDRPCCHMCKEELANKKNERQSKINDMRYAHKEQVAQNVIENIVRTYLSNRRFDKLRRRVLWAQTKGRRLVARNKFIRNHLIPRKRIMKLFVDEVAFYVDTINPNFSDTASVGGIISIYDQTQRVLLYSSEMPFTPLTTRRRKRSNALTSTAQALRFTVSSVNSHSLTRSDSNSSLSTALSQHLQRARVLHKIKRTLIGFEIRMHLVFTLFLRYRTGIDDRVEVDRLLGQGSLPVRANDFYTFLSDVNKAPTQTVQLDAAVRFPYKQKGNTLEIKENLEIEHSTKIKISNPSISFRLFAPSSLYNMCGWLEGPHYDILKRPEHVLAVSVSKTARTQYWFAVITDGEFQLYRSDEQSTERTPRFRYPAHKPIAERDSKQPAFALSFPDRRSKWLFKPLIQSELHSWVSALAYWRLLKGGGGPSFSHSHEDAIRTVFKEGKLCPRSSTSS